MTKRTQHVLEVIMMLVMVALVMVPFIGMAIDHDIKHGCFPIGICDDSAAHHMMSATKR